MKTSVRKRICCTTQAHRGLCVLQVTCVMIWWQLLCKITSFNSLSYGRVLSKAAIETKWTETKVRLYFYLSAREYSTGNVGIWCIIIFFIITLNENDAKVKRGQSWITCENSSTNTMVINTAINLRYPPGLKVFLVVTVGKLLLFCLSRTSVWQVQPQSLQTNIFPRKYNNFFL